MDELDEKSKVFITRTLAKLADDNQFRELVNEVMWQTFRFYFDTPRDTLISLCEKKMIAGAKEHGEPKTDPSAVLKEIRMEDLDKLLWTCMWIEARDELSS